MSVSVAPDSMDLQLYALPFLKLVDDCKKIARLGIPFRAEHPHKAFGRFFRQVAQLFKAHGRLDVIS